MAGGSGRSRPHRVQTTGNLNQSMRTNYGEHGVDDYYKQVGASYRNPHFPGVRACMFAWLERWWAHEKRSVGSRSPLLFDMACGGVGVLKSRRHRRQTIVHESGEVTVASYEWWKRGFLGMESRNTRIAHRPSQKEDASSSSNSTGGPAEESPAIDKWQVPDDLLIAAADPYTQEAYRERTTLPCAPLAFRDISEGLLPRAASSAAAIGVGGAGNVDWSFDRIDIVVCSFALHLIESSSELYALLRELSTKALWLVVLAPHKKPEIKEGWGWVKWDCETWNECSMHDRKEFVRERVHCRVYRSINTLGLEHEIVETGNSPSQDEPMRE